MAGNPLRYINAYLLEDDGGYTLVDCGWKADDVYEALIRGLGELGRSLDDVARLAITHFHFDHYGLAGTLRRAGVAELLMHARDWHFASVRLGDTAAADLIADEWIARNGFESDASIEDEVRHSRTELMPPTREIEDGERIGRLRAVWTPGHTPGHLCYVDERSGRVLTGDHVLDPITPHIGMWFPDRGDPLGDYLASLEKIGREGAVPVLPAHGEPFPDLAHRIERLLYHHRLREGQILEVLLHGPASAADIARALPWTRREISFETLGEAHKSFAVAETIAHLEHLRVRGIVRHEGEEDPIRYVLAHRS